MTIIKNNSIHIIFNCVAIAEQITLGDFWLFKQIHPREFLEKVWKGPKINNNNNNDSNNNNNNKNNVKKVSHLEKMILRFNETHKYVILTIISCKSLKERMQMLCHFIDVCESLLDNFNNYFSLMSVFSALDRMILVFLNINLRKKPHKNNLQKQFQPFKITKMSTKHIKQHLYL